MKLSVIICTHNPRQDYLSLVLENLRVQTLDVDEWELLIVDNFSDDPVEKGIDVSWHPNVLVVVENELGLTPARLRGIFEAKADLLLFVDDDGVLDSNYLEESLVVADKYPDIGVWGGKVTPEFEENPDAWTQEFWPHLAVRTVEKEIWSNFVGYPNTLPCGVGMCVRSIVAQAYNRWVSDNSLAFGLDRKGTSLVSGGDDDIARLAHRLGMATGLFPNLHLKHLIPASRLTEEYLLRLVEAQAYSGVIIDSLHHAGVQLTMEHPIRGCLGWIKRRLTMGSRKRSFIEAKSKGKRRAIGVLMNTIQLNSIDES